MARTNLVASALAAALGLITSCHKEKEPPGGAAAGASAPQSPAELDAPIAQIDNVVITVREFQDRINRQSPYVRARYDSIEQRKEFLDSLVRYEVLAKEAYRRGLDKDPEAIRALKTVMIQKLMKDEFEKPGAKGPESVPETELRAYYEAHQGEWNKPEEVRVSAIVVSGKAQAETVAKAALGDEGRTNKGFRDLVAKWSTDEESKLRGGDLRYFAQGAANVPVPVVTAAFALAKVGDLAGPIDAGSGKYYVIKQTGRRRATFKDFEAVKRQIQNTLWKDSRVAAQKAFVEGLKARAKILVFDANLKHVRVEPSATGDDGHGHAGLDAPFPGELRGEPGQPAPAQEAP
jgi:peptidyl-prolyl cis-trans isomerase C